MASKRRPNPTPTSAACLHEPDFVAENDGFLDSISVMLQRLEMECSSALEWSEEAEEVATRAAEAFFSIPTVCEGAGMLAPEYLAELPTSTSSHEAVTESLADLTIELSSPCASCSPMRHEEMLMPRIDTSISIDKPHSRCDFAQQVQFDELPLLLLPRSNTPISNDKSLFTNSRCALMHRVQLDELQASPDDSPLRHGELLSPHSDTCTSNDKSPSTGSRCGFVQHVQLDELHAALGSLDLSQRKEIIEVELTDLLTHTHEEIQSCRHEFTLQVQEADRKQTESYQKTQSDIETLKIALMDSQDTVTKLQQELYDMRQSVEAFQVSVLDSQKSMEAAMKEQSAHWKSMCSDLVIEKRNVAKKLAEERGKYASLKEHLAMHANPIQVDANHSSQSAHDAHSRASPSAKVTTDEVASNSSPCSNGLSSIIPMQLTPSASSVHKNLASEDEEDISFKCISEPRSCSVVSPASSHQSSMRELRTSDLSASHSRVSSSSVDPVKNDASAGETATTTTASFRRYYLSKSSSSSSRFFARSSSSLSSNSINSTPSSKRSCS
ncbi:hypothetical protein FI667_g5428, partial [Globisporangium splendens]